MAWFGTEKVLGKEKNIKENNFLMFSFTMENIIKKKIKYKENSLKFYTF